MRKEDHCHGELDPTVDNPGLMVHSEARMPQHSAVCRMNWPSARVRSVTFRHA